MASTLGVALEADVVRAAMRSNGQTSVAEVPWDPAFPDAAVDTLRTKFGNVQGIALSVGLAFLEIAQPELPPLGAIDKRRVLLRDADRYFPLEGSAAISGPDSSGAAFATSSDRLHRWIRAFEEWAPVSTVVAAPNAIAAGVSMVHRAATNGVRLLVVDAAVDEYGFVRLKDGAVAEVRRVPLALKSTLPSNAERLSDVYLPGSKGEFATALGAALLAGTAVVEMLLDARLEATLRGRLTRRKWTSIAGLAVALLLLGVAVDARHDKSLRVTTQVSDSLWVISKPGREALTRLANLDRELGVLRDRGTSIDPLGIVAALSTALPQDAFVERVTWDGAEWRIDGSTDRAASIVPSLDSASLFANVRVLTASTRFRDGSRMRESFSVAFKVKGDSVAKR